MFVSIMSSLMIRRRFRWSAIAGFFLWDSGFRAATDRSKQRVQTRVGTKFVTQTALRAGGGPLLVCRTSGHGLLEADGVFSIFKIGWSSSMPNSDIGGPSTPKDSKTSFNEGRGLSRGGGKPQRGRTPQLREILSLIDEKTVCVRRRTRDAPSFGPCFL